MVVSSIDLHESSSRESPMVEGNSDGDGNDGNGKAHRAVRLDLRRASSPAVLGPRHSGRRFVVTAVAVLLLVWGCLYLTFRVWRAGYRQQTAFARNLVPPAVDGFLAARPPDFSEREWREIVTRTHAMLDMLIGANLLDRAGVLSLRDDLSNRAAVSKPATALNDVIRIWSDMEFKASPSLARATRPSTIDLAVVVDSLERVPPGDVPPAEWPIAVSETRNMLIAWARSGGLDDDVRAALRKRWSDLILTVRDQPARAKGALEQIWIDVEREPSWPSSPRPALLR
jgi:hypothetical protein